MKEDTIKIEAASIEECRKSIKARVPDGFRIASETVVRFGKPKQYSATGDTPDEALKAARKLVPAAAEVLGEKILAEPSHTQTQVEAESETSARSVSGSDLDSGSRVDSVTVIRDGKKGFLGIGKRLPLWSVTVFHPAKVQVSAKETAVLVVSLREREKLRFRTPDGSQSIVQLVEVMFVGIDLPDDMVEFIPTVITIDDIIPRFRDMGEHKLTKHNAPNSSSAGTLIGNEAAQRGLNVLITPQLDYDPQLSMNMLGRRIQFMLGIMTTVAEGRKPQVVIARSEAELSSVLSLT